MIRPIAETLRSFASQARSNNYGVVGVTVAVVTLVAIATSACGSDQREIAAEPPVEWQGYDVGLGEISVPQDFTRGEVDEDGPTTFEGAKVKLYVNWGEGIATPVGRAADVERESVRINGRPTELYEFSQPSEGNIPGPSLGHWKVAVIDGTESGGRESDRQESDVKIVVWATYAESDDAETVERIFGSFSPK